MCSQGTTLKVSRPADAAQPRLNFVPYFAPAALTRSNFAASSCFSPTPLPMIHTRLFSFLVLVALVLTGCTSAKITGQGSKPILVNQPTGEVDVVERISETKRFTFDYTGSLDIADVVGETLANSDADALINTQIAVKSTAADFFINVFTLGIANAYTVEITGELVRTSGDVTSMVEDGTVLGRSASLDALTVDASQLAPGTHDAVLIHTDGEFVLVKPAVR